MPFLNQQDHPRVCGENTALILQTQNEKGSPPRVRGKLNVGHMDSWADRITPACAGKTEQKGEHERDGQDHPRVCGENGTSWKTGM